MSKRQSEDVTEDGRWWRLDFTMVLVLMVVVSFLLLIGFELWHPNP